MWFSGKQLVRHFASGIGELLSIPVSVEEDERGDSIKFGDTTIDLSQVWGDRSSSTVCGLVLTHALFHGVKQRAQKRAAELNPNGHSPALVQLIGLISEAVNATPQFITKLPNAERLLRAYRQSLPPTSDLPKNLTTVQLITKILYLDPYPNDTVVLIWDLRESFPIRDFDLFRRALESPLNREQDLLDSLDPEKEPGKGDQEKQEGGDSKKSKPSLQDLLDNLDAGLDPFATPKSPPEFDEVLWAQMKMLFTNALSVILSCEEATVYSLPDTIGKRLSGSWTRLLTDGKVFHSRTLGEGEDAAVFLALDNSGSMQQILSPVQAITYAFITALVENGTPVACGYFSDSYREISPRDDKAWRLVPQGGCTKFYFPLVAAIRFFSTQRAKKKLCFLVTDGDLGDPMSIPPIIQKLNDLGVKVFFLGIGQVSPFPGVTCVEVPPLQMTLLTDLLISSMETQVV